MISSSYNRIVGFPALVLILSLLLCEGRLEHLFHTNSTLESKPYEGRELVYLLEDVFPRVPQI